MSERLKVALFAGGRGAATIAQALARHPAIDLTVLVNAYDDGLSTGRLRRFVPGMLGPSDVRKNLVHLLLGPDGADAALRALLDARLPEGASWETGVRCLEAAAGLGPLPLEALEELHRRLSVRQAREAAAYSGRMLEHVRRRREEGEAFDFGDCAVGNLLFAGCYLLHGREFNEAVRRFGDFCGAAGRVLNVTRGENLVLVGIKEDGTLLEDEARIVAAQNPSSVAEIFLLERYLSGEEAAELSAAPFEEKARRLRELSRTPALSPEADRALREADLILYGPGTQHSSLLPSYLTEGVAEAVAANADAEKVFIANIRKDHEIQSETTRTLVRKLLHYLRRKDAVRIDAERLVTRFFFQKPDELYSASADYLAYSPDPALPSERIVHQDWEAGAGVHLGGKVLDEVIALANARAQVRLKASPYMVSIIVPALDEARTIPRVLHELVLLNFQPLGLGKEIVFVDGGSSDGSYELAAAEGSVRAYRLEGRPGRGAALRHGIEKAQGNVIVFFPSDGEYRAADLIPIVEAVAREDFGVVFGSRAIKCVNLTDRAREIYRGNLLGYLVGKYGGILLSVTSLLLYNRFVSDPLTGIKAFDARLLRELGLRSRGLDLETEIIAKLGRRRAFIFELPVHYRPRRKDEGKKTTILDGIKAFLALLRYKLAR